MLRRGCSGSRPRASPSSTCSRASLTGDRAGRVDRLGGADAARGCARPAIRGALLLGLALRRNPRRAHLLVSRVLGKHVPTDPRVVQRPGCCSARWSPTRWPDGRRAPLPVDLLHAAVPGRAGRRGGAARRRAARGRRRTAVDAVVLGFAETATALGHCVAEALGGADYLHSTRRRCRASPPRAASRRSTPTPPGTCCCRPTRRCWRRPRPLVLVDDELSTGRTALTRSPRCTALAPRAHYVVAALVDLRERRARRAARRGAGRRRGAGPRRASTLPPDLAERAAALRAELAAPRPSRPPRRRSVAATPPLDAAAPEPRTGAACAAEPVRGRSGRACPGRPRLAGRAAGGRAARVHRRRPRRARRRAARAGRGLARAAAPAGERTLVLGTEELMSAAAAAGRRRSPTRGPRRRGSPPPPAPPPSPSTSPATPSQRARLPRPRRPRTARPALRLQRRRPAAAVGPRRCVVVDPPGRHARPCAPACSPRSPRTPGAPPWWSRREHPRAAARARVRQLPARRGRLAAHRPLRRRARGADRGARGGHPDRRRALRRVAAASSTSPTPRTCELFHAALADSAARLAHAVGVVTELVLGRARAATSCSSRWPAPAPRSAS